MKLIFAFIVIYSFAFANCDLFSRKYSQQVSIRIPKVKEMGLPYLINGNIQFHWEQGMEGKLPIFFQKDAHNNILKLESLLIENLKQRYHSGIINKQESIELLAKSFERSSAYDYQYNIEKGDYLIILDKKGNISREFSISAEKIFIYMIDGKPLEEVVPNRFVKYSLWEQSLKNEARVLLFKSSRPESWGQASQAAGISKKNRRHWREQFAKITIEKW